MFLNYSVEKNCDCIGEVGNVLCPTFNFVKFHHDFSQLCRANGVDMLVRRLCRGGVSCWIVGIIISDTSFAISFGSADVCLDWVRNVAVVIWAGMHSIWRSSTKTH